MIRYIPANPISVKRTLPEETRGETPSDVLKMPYEPGLTAEFGGEPPGGVRDEREGHGEHQDPEHPAGAVQKTPPQQERGDDHDRYEDGPEADHDVVTVVEERDVLRPVLLREGVETLHLGVPVLVDEVAEGARHDDRVLYALVLDIRLADEDDACLPLRPEEALHGGERDGLVFGDLVAGEGPLGKSIQRLAITPAVIPTLRKTRP